MNLEERNRAILTIANKVFNLTTPDRRKSDRLDFHNIAVWKVREALEMAYEAGFKAAGGVVDDRSE
jgi:hypothetical protein